MAHRNATARRDDCDPAVEREVLGSILSFPPACAEVLERGIDAADFSMPGHRTIFESVAALVADGESVTEITAAERLDNEGKLAEVGGADELAALAAEAVPAAIRSHVGVLRRARQAREKREIAGELANGLPPGDAIERLHRVESLTAPTSHRLEVLDTADLLASDPPSVDWRVENLAAPGAFTVLAAAPDGGKSYLMEGVGSALGHGAESLAGLGIPSAGTCIYVDAEMSRHEHHRRAHLLGPDPEKFTVCLADGLDLRVPEDRAAIAAQIAGHDVTVLDSLSALVPGLEENDASAVSPVANAIKDMARQTGTAIVLIHHTDKPGRTYRGSVALAAAADIVAILAREPEDPDSYRRRLTWSSERGGKMRLSDPPDDVFYRMERLGEAMTFTECEPPEPAEDAEKPPTRREKLRERLVAHITEHGPQKLSEAARGIGEDARNQGPRRALTDALEAGELTRDSEGLIHSVRQGDAATDGATVTTVRHPSVTPDGDGVDDPEGSRPVTPRVPTGPDAGVTRATSPVRHPDAEAEPAAPDQQAEAERLAEKFPEVAS